jgi:MFS family permease
MSDPAAINWRGWGAVAVLLVLSIVSSIDRSLISLLVEPLKADLGLSDFQIGLVQGLGFGLFYAVLGVPMGMLIDRYPRKLVVWGGVTVWSLCAAACGLAGNFTQLLLARFGVGAGEATLSPAAYSIIGDHFPPRRLAFAMGVFGVGGILGISAALTVGGVIIAWAESVRDVAWPLVGVLKPWQLAFIVAGLPGVFAAFLILLVPENPRGHGSAAAGLMADAGLAEFLRLRWKLLACHFTGFGIVAMLAYGMMAWAPVFLMRRFGVSILDAGMMLGSVAALAGVGGMLFNGWWVDRRFAGGRVDSHLRHYVAVCGIGAVAAVLAFSGAQSVAQFLVPYTLVYFLQPFTGPAAAMIQIVTPPQLRGRVAALFLLVMNLMGLCLGPALIGLLTDFVLHDPGRVGDALSLAFILLSPPGIALFLAGAREMRKSGIGAAPVETAR